MLEFYTHVWAPTAISPCISQLAFAAPHLQRQKLACLHVLRNITILIRLYK